MIGKRNIAAVVAEFLGTGILTLLVLSVQRSTIGVPFFVAMAAGLTLVVLMFALGSISGGYFNPAITFAMWTAGLWTARKIAALRALIYIVVEFLGAWVAYYLYTFFANNALSPIGGHFTKRIFYAELVGAAIFAFGWAATAYQKFTEATKAAVVGVSYVIGIIAASSAAIGLANPALALGVRAFVWAYILGPVVGAVVAVNVYALLFAPSDVDEMRLVPATVSPAVATASVTEAAVVKTRKKRATKPTTKTRATRKSTGAKRATRTTRTTRSTR